MYLEINSVINNSFKIAQGQQLKEGRGKLITSALLLELYFILINPEGQKTKLTLARFKTQNTKSHKKCH